MKTKLSFILLFAFMACSKKQHSISEFNQYNADAPNRVVQPIQNFKSFEDVDISRQDNGDFVIEVHYNAKNNHQYTAVGVFNFNGKMLFNESGQ